MCTRIFHLCIVYSSSCRPTSGTRCSRAAATTRSRRSCGRGRPGHAPSGQEPFTHGRKERATGLAGVPTRASGRASSWITHRTSGAACCSSRPRGPAPSTSTGSSATRPQATTPRAWQRRSSATGVCVMRPPTRPGCSPVERRRSHIPFPWRLDRDRTPGCWRPCTSRRARHRCGPATTSPKPVPVPRCRLTKPGMQCDWKVCCATRSRDSSDDVRHLVASSRVSPPNICESWEICCWHASPMFRAVRPTSHSRGSRDPGSSSSSTRG